jgi:hypothetical protein
MSFVISSWTGDRLGFALVDGQPGSFVCEFRFLPEDELQCELLGNRILINLSAKGLCDFYPSKDGHCVKSKNGIPLFSIHRGIMSIDGFTFKAVEFH